MTNRLHVIVPALLTMALGAADVSVERAVREQESVQRGVTANTAQTVQRAALLADDLRFNRIGSEADVTAVTTIAQGLDGIVQAPGEAPTMRRVEERLASARRGGGDTDLAAAAQTQGTLAEQLDKLVVKAKPRTSGSQALSEAIQQQRQVMEETAKQADQTLGKERHELNTQEKANLEKLARQERQLDQAVKDAAKALHEQAKQEQDPVQQKKTEDAAKQLEKPDTAKPIKEAADKLAENKLAEAQDHQQKALDKLEQAAKAMGAEQKTDLAQADKDLQHLEQMANREQKLLDQLPQAAQPQTAEWNAMQAEQQDIAKKLEEMQSKAAQSEAEKAAQAMEKRDPAQSREAMKRTLDALKAAQQQAQAQMMAMRQKQDQQQKPAQPGKESGKPPEQAGAEEAKNPAKRKGAWQVGLEGQEREVLSQSRAEHFPARYEQALVRYYRTLAGEP